MKTLEFSPRPGGLPNDSARAYRPGTDLSSLAFAEQFLVWAMRAARLGKDRAYAHIRLTSAFAALDAPDACALLQRFVGLFEMELGRPLAAPCLKWRSLMADEARVLTLIHDCQRASEGKRAMPPLPQDLSFSGQQLALSLSAAGLALRPVPDAPLAQWPEGMPQVH
ncbi:MAG: hypothetical protein RLO08_06665 [Parvibaculaceae bacterium]